MVAKNLSWLAPLVQAETQLGTGKYLAGRLSLDQVNVLPQPRRTFEDIDALADDIAEKGVLKPPIVARFDAASCEQHLRLLNDLRGTKFDRGTLMRSKDKAGACYFVLLAGERRYRAHRHLWEKGCSVCRAAHGSELPGTCFRRHIEDGCMEVRLCYNINSLRALFLQLSENTHHTVPVHEEAQAYAELFRLLRSVDHGYSLAAFARKVGRTVETVRRALRFAELPLKVQNYVEKKVLGYGLTLEIARWQDEMIEAKRVVDPERLELEAELIIAHRYSLTDYRKIVDQRITELKSRQTSLLEMMTAAQEKEAIARDIKRVVAVHDLQFLDASLNYLTRVRRTFETPNGKERFSARSPRKRLLQIADQVKALLQRYDATSAQLTESQKEDLHARCLRLTDGLEQAFELLCDGFSKSAKESLISTIATARALLATPIAEQGSIPLRTGIIESVCAETG